MLVSLPGIEPGLWQEKGHVLITGVLGNSQSGAIIIFILQIRKLMLMNLRDFTKEGHQLTLTEVGFKFR